MQTIKKSITNYEMRPLSEGHSSYAEIGRNLQKCTLDEAFVLNLTAKCPGKPQYSANVELRLSLSDPSPILRAA